MAQAKPTVKLSCVGCQHRPENCAEMVNDPEWYKHMTICAEPTNPYDSNAIAIRYQGKNVGYVPKHQQAEVWSLLGKQVEWAIKETAFMDAERTILKWVEFEVTV